MPETNTPTRLAAEALATNGVLADAQLRGLITQTAPPWGSATAAPASLSEFAVRLWLPPGGAKITGAIVNVSNAGGTLTSGQNLLTLYTSAGVKQASCADQTTAWAGTGNLPADFTGGPFTLTDPYVYVGVLSNGTTPATFRVLTGDANWSNVGFGGLLSGASMFSGRIGAAVTAPASFTPSALSNRGSLYWIGLY